VQSVVGPLHPLRRLVIGALVLIASAADAGSTGQATHFLDGPWHEFEADGDADTYAGPAPLAVRFTSRVKNASGRVTYVWNFDDGSRSTDSHPRHTFRKRGWYLVTMDATDAAGHTYRVNLQLHAWRPRDWTRFQQHRDMRIPEHAARELVRKRQRAAEAAKAPVAPSP